MCELIVGGKDGLQPVEKTIIDRSVRMVYQEFLADPKPEKMPILEEDVYKRQLSEFIGQTLKMELSEEKTLITHSSDCLLYTSCACATAISSRRISSRPPSPT